MPDPLPQRLTHKERISWDRVVREISVLRENRPFVRLVSAWFVNGLANGIPSALFLLFLEHRLQADAGQKASELFDVVNERNEVTGQLTRGEVHARGLLHRAVHIFVVNRRGEVFLQKRSHLKDVAPLRWDSSAAGHLDAADADLARTALQIVTSHAEADAVDSAGDECGLALKIGHMLFLFRLAG